MLFIMKFCLISAFVPVTIVQLIFVLVLVCYIDASNQDPAYVRQLLELRAKDKCSAIYTSKLHGYDIQQHKVTTEDHYVLSLHRIIHPSDMATNGPRPGSKKPYLLVHGLLGSSASYMRNIPDNYEAPIEPYKVKSKIRDTLQHKTHDYEHFWTSTADYYKAAFEGDISASLDGLTLREKLLNKANKKTFGALFEMEFGSDQTNFAESFRQAYRKFDLPTGARGFVTNSLAFTLSNFGYDVWLLNLRGNEYSKEYDGPLAVGREEFWNFNIDTLVRQDLPSSIDYVRKFTNHFAPIGLVTYSYTSIIALSLLTKFPAYQESVQPTIMLAPAVLTSTHDRGRMQSVVKYGTKALISKNGPFPSLSGARYSDKIEKLICALPIASKLCHFFETALHGRRPSMKNIVFDDRKTAMIKRDVSCGRTSKALLHQIVNNLSDDRIDNKYKPTAMDGSLKYRGRLARRSIMMVHSSSDEISSLEDVSKIRASLKTLGLVDYLIEEPRFEHTDFLFCIRNQYLVNAEVLRMAAVFDYLVDNPASNAPLARSFSI